jgi:hypothetical protein
MLDRGSASKSGGSSSVALSHAANSGDSGRIATSWSRYARRSSGVMAWVEAAGAHASRTKIATLCTMSLPPSENPGTMPDSM